MGFLIDASILIAWERARLDIEAQVRDRSEEALFLSVITASELLHGVHRAQNAPTQARRSTFVESALAQFPLLEIDLATAREHARTWAALAARGQIIGPHDLWLAATCLTHGLTMATHNVREFERVPGLTVESWR